MLCYSGEFSLRKIYENKKLQIMYMCDNHLAYYVIVIKQLHNHMYM